MNTKMQLRLWDYLQQMCKAEKRKGGRVFVKIEMIIRMDPSLSVEDIISDFMIILLDDSSTEEKDFIKLRTEMADGSSDYFLRRKLSFAFRTFVNNKVRSIKKRKNLMDNLAVEDIAPARTPNPEEMMRHKEICVRLTQEEMDLLQWRLREQSTEEVMRNTGYSSRQSLYNALEGLRSKILSTENMKEGK